MKVTELLTSVHFFKTRFFIETSDIRYIVKYIVK